MWWLIGIALQTTKAVVPGSNPASLTMKNSEDRQSHCVYCLGLKKDKKKKLTP